MFSFEDDNIFIYGDGKFGRLLACYCFRKQIPGVTILVTDATGKEHTIFEYPVKSFAEEKEHLTGAQVFLAMSYRSAKDIYEMVAECHPKSIEIVTAAIISEIVSDLFSGEKVDRNKVFFNCYGGQGYRCNLRAIAEEIFERARHGDPFCSNIQMVWGVHSYPDSTLPPEVIQADESDIETYFKQFYSSAVIVSNMNTTAGLPKNPHQYILNTWHGSGPFKKAGALEPGTSEDIKKNLEAEYNRADAMIIAAGQNEEVYRTDMLFHGPILPYGYPRNDVLINLNQREELAAQIRKKFQIADDCGVLLYAPTFRHEGNDGFGMYDLDMRAVLDALSSRFGRKFVLLYRYHHNLRHDIKHERNFEGGIDVTFYPDIMDLMTASDVMITDYSSSMWDFSLMYRPVFLYHKDIAEYEDDRGFFWPPERWPYPKAHSTEEMCQQILNFDEDAYYKALDRFFEEDPSYDDGHASERVVDLIVDVMQHPEKYGKA